MGTEIAQRAEVDAESSKFLTFQLQHEEYGLEILKVREIMGLMEITTVPQTPSYVRGVINLRGQVIPVVDLRLKFGMKEGADDKRTCIIVVDVGGLMMGIVVDTVSEVMDISASSIEATPSFGTKLNTDYILGMGKVQGKVKILLDIDRVLTSEELVMVSELQREEKAGGKGDKKGKAPAKEEIRKN